MLCFIAGVIGSSLCRAGAEAQALHRTTAAFECAAKERSLPLAQASASSHSHCDRVGPTRTWRDRLDSVVDIQRRAMWRAAIWVLRATTRSTASAAAPGLRRPAAGWAGTSLGETEHDRIMGHNFASYL